jgi:hypothetical protein
MHKNIPGVLKVEPLMDTIIAKKYCLSTELHRVFRAHDIYSQHYVEFSKGLMLVRYKINNRNYIKRMRMKIFNKGHNVRKLHQTKTF